jgi:hypothetical protein
LRTIRLDLLLSGINLRAVRGKASLALLRRTWYRRLARINLLIVEARQRIAIQKAHISNLEREERGTRSALARLRRSEVMQQLLEGQRKVILEKVRRSPLPAELCEANSHF